MRSPKNLQSPLEETRRNLLKLKEIDRQRLEAKRQKYTTATHFLNGVYPRLGASAPPRLREKAIMEHTTHHLEAAERRLGACATCPVGGGACADDSVGHRPGLVPVWQKGSERGPIELQLVECSKWPEWNSRCRLRRAGVEPRIEGTALEDLGDRVVKKTASALWEFLHNCRTSEDPNLVVAGKASTLVAVGLLRSLLAAIPDMNARFVRVPKQAKPLKQHYADPERYEHPLNPLLKLELLILVEMSIYKTDWFDDELRDLVYSRYLDNLPTVIATEEEEAQIVASHYFRTTVPACLTK